MSVLNLQLLLLGGEPWLAGFEAFRNTFNCMVSLVLPLTFLLILFTPAGFS